MSASDLFKAGRLREALEAQTQEVKAAPADPTKRIFLFELLCFAGEWERAQKQINVIHYDDVQREMVLNQYRLLLDAETHRRAVFAGTAQPKFLIPPPRHVEMRLTALHALANNKPDEAAKILQEAIDCTPEIGGQLNGTTFKVLHDADDLFGPILEFMNQGNYFWVPLEHVESLGMNAPQYPRDLIWIPARLEVRDSANGEVYIPGRYPGSEKHSDPTIQLGRLTDWKQPAEGFEIPVQGLGLHEFVVDEELISILDFRELVCLPPDLVPTDEANAEDEDSADADESTS